MALDEILYIATGGAIDQIYSASKGRMTVHDPAVSSIVSRARPVAPYHSMQLLQHEGGLLDERECAHLYELCQELDVERIVITTDGGSMLQLAERLSSIPKTIVLTGATKPACMAGSDAEYNVGFATCAAKSKPQGTYIAMNGEVYDWDKVTRDREGRFVPVDVPYAQSCPSTDPLLRLAAAIQGASLENILRVMTRTSDPVGSSWLLHMQRRL